MPGFLASVKNIEEAKKICELDIDIVDFKKVDDGALGFVGSNTVRQVRKLLHNHVISVTMGNDLNPYNESYINNINLTIQNNIEYLKIGLFDISMISEHKKLIEEIDFLESQPICVIFADQSFDLSIMQRVIDIGYKGIMIDTFHKANKSTLDLINKTDLNKFVDIVKNNNLICGLSGSLKLHHIGELKNLNVDFLGFRGQLCSEINSRESINVNKVNEVYREIKS